VGFPAGYGSEQSRPGGIAGGRGPRLGPAARWLPRARTS